MKPEIYYENKNQEILNKVGLLNLQIPRAANNGGKDLDSLRQRVFDFIALAPDFKDFYTDETWVAAWKSAYNRLSESIRDIKDVGDYRLDSKKREMSTVAKALLAVRHGVYWIK